MDLEASTTFNHHSAELQHARERDRERGREGRCVTRTWPHGAGVFFFWFLVLVVLNGLSPVRESVAIRECLGEEFARGAQGQPVEVECPRR